MSKLWLMKPNLASTNAEEIEGRYQLVGSVYWEMEILNKDNMSHAGKKKKVNVLDEMFKNMTFGK